MANDPGGSPAATQDNPTSPPARGGDAVVLVDSLWRITAASASSAFASFAKPLPDEPLLEAFPALLNTPLHARLLEAMSTRQPTAIDGYHPPLAAWVEVHAWPTADGGLAVVALDVTARRAAEEDCRRLLAIIESSGDAIVAIDSGGLVTNWNPAAERTYGHPATAIVGRPATDLAPPASRPAFSDLLARVLRGGATERCEVAQLTRDGRTIDVAATLAPVRDPAGRVAGASMVARDLSDQRRAQLLREENQRLESAGEAKDQFLAVLSHELRTPLTPVLMAASTLEQDPTLPAAVRDEIAAIRRNVELEARLIDDLLDLNRITRGKLAFNLQTADLHSLIGHALYVAREDILAKKLWLQMDLRAEHPAVRADPVRLQQVLWNLLKNAVKFTPESGTLIVRSADRPDGIVRVEVQDTGVGIAPEALARIFNPFEQANGTARAAAAAGSRGEPGGLGLGLAICKALVELHGGRIWAESAGPGRGATFVVELPTTTAAPATATPATPSSPATLAARLAILVVEDHASTASLLARALRGFGHDVATAATLREANQAVAGRRFDLLISDLGLPDGSGLDLMRRLRSDTPSLRGIALSGYGMEDDVRKSAEAGFAAHLTKPVALQQLREAVAKVTTNGNSASNGSNGT